MSTCFKYLDLPRIPQSLYCEIYNSIITNPNYFYFPKVPYYKIHKVNFVLNDFIKNLIPNAKIVSVQIIRKDIPIHTDMGRTEAINYIISPGGDDVYTCFYAEDNLEQKYKIETERWHWLNVSLPHRVINLDNDNPRVAVTVNL
jgi:hypothetical protein